MTPADTLTVLHLSDLHWSEEKSKDQRIVIEALIRDLKTFRSDGLTPDIVIFSGDLVQSGDDPALFAGVSEAFIKPVLEETSPAPLILCPGNHDISRKAVREASFIETGLKADLISVDRVNKFIDDLKGSGAPSSVALSRMANYDAALSSLVSMPASSTEPLLRIYKATVREKLIGVVAFNTAWRATGEPGGVDRHALILGERNVDQAIDGTSDCDIRIAVFHHPLDWLAEFDEISVTARLHSEFDVLMCGHTHRSSPELRMTTQGRALLSQAGCVYQNRDYFNGYQFIKLDYAAAQAEFTVRTYYNQPSTAVCRSRRYRR